MGRRPGALTEHARDLAQGTREPGTDIVPARSSDPVVAKQHMAAGRAEAERTQAAIREKRPELKRLLRAEMQPAEELLGPMQDLVNRLKRASDGQLVPRAPTSKAG